MVNITLPEVWGPAAWYLLHHITRNLTADKVALIDFFTILWVFIPCAICRNHYMDYVKKDPYIDHLDEIDKWGFELHNKINKMLNKAQMSYETFRKTYSKKPTSPQLKKFIDIIVELHLTPDISLSEIQDLKKFLKTILLLYPLPIAAKSKTAALDKLANVYDYYTLKSYYRTYSVLL